MADSHKIWDTDDRFTGVADASAFAPAVEERAALARRPGWVAEDPEIHLMPHVRGASVDGVRIVEIRTEEDGVLAVDAECDSGASRGELRRRAWVLLGTVAEPAASVRERAAIATPQSSRVSALRQRERGCSIPARCRIHDGLVIGRARHLGEAEHPAPGRGLVGPRYIAASNGFWKPAAMSATSDPGQMSSGARIGDLASPAATRPPRRLTCGGDG